MLNSKVYVIGCGMTNVRIEYNFMFCEFYCINMYLVFQARKGIDLLHGNGERSSNESFK